MNSSRVVVIVVVLVLTATLVSADRDCKYSADREAIVAADGVSRVEIDAGAGFLKVRGAAGLEEIRASGEACSSKESRLDEGIPQGESRVELTYSSGSLLFGLLVSVLSLLILGSVAYWSFRVDRGASPAPDGSDEPAAKLRLAG